MPGETASVDVEFRFNERWVSLVSMLVTTNDAILNIALASGFQSLSRFNEAFKMACGCSPRDYRKAHQADLR